ncbi:hypothetical protein ACFLWO_04645 [Chloroflexota bacterium]
MPKPRSYIPALITLLAILVVIGVAIEEYIDENLLSDTLEIVILVIAAIIPIISYIIVFWREKLQVILNKLDEKDRKLVEKVVSILEQIYFDEKDNIESISKSITELDTEKVNKELNHVIGLGYFEKLQEYDSKVDAKEKIKMICFIGWALLVLVTISFSKFIFPYFIREYQFFLVSSVPSVLGITKSDENTPLYQQLSNESIWIRTDDSVNVIRKCLKYSHATNNLYLISLINKDKVETSNNRWMKVYANYTSGYFNHLMEQRFAEVANILSKEFRG